jgi:hypothetical protein
MHELRRNGIGINLELGSDPAPLLRVLAGPPRLMTPSLAAVGQQVCQIDDQIKRLSKAAARDRDVDRVRVCRLRVFVRSLSLMNHISSLNWSDIHTALSPDSAELVGEPVGFFGAPRPHPLNHCCTTSAPGGTPNVSTVAPPTQRSAAARINRMRSVLPNGDIGKSTTQQNCRPRTH